MMNGTLTLESEALDLPVPANPVERLGALFDAHHARLYRLARRLSGDPEEARDLVQETFLRAARRAETIPDGDAAEAWLVRVLVNLCRDRWRRQKVRREAGPAPVWGRRTPATPEATSAARARVEAALARLQPRTRAVIVLHEIQGLETSEVAAMLGVREVTVRWHVSTGRAKVRRWLAATAEGAAEPSAPVETRAEPSAAVDDPAAALEDRRVSRDDNEEDEDSSP